MYCSRREPSSWGTRPRGNGTGRGADKAVAPRSKATSGRLPCCVTLPAPREGGTGTRGLPTSAASQLGRLDMERIPFRRLDDPSNATESQFGLESRRSWSAVALVSRVSVRPGRLTTETIKAMAETASPSTSIGTRHPPPVMALPTFRWRPLLVSGIPVDLEILDFARVTPVARFHENPPLFIPGLDQRVRLPLRVVASAETSRTLQVREKPNILEPCRRV